MREAVLHLRALPLCAPEPAITRTCFHQETTMKSKRESASKAKGNGSAKYRRESAIPDPSPVDSDGPRRQMIAEAAYFRAEQRGFEPGNEMHDWLQAEADIERLSGVGH